MTRKTTGPRDDMVTAALTDVRQAVREGEANELDCVLRMARVLCDPWRAVRVGDVLNLWVKRKEKRRAMVAEQPGDQLTCGKCGDIAFIVYRVRPETVVLCLTCGERVMTFMDT